MDGVIVVDKPAGWTSHDAVRKVKSTLGAVKVGHLGTLDPMATGVLPLVINKATKFASALEGSLKIYTGRLKLSIETDSYDGDGRVVKEASAGHVTEYMVTAVLQKMIGRIRQVPPMYSAIKIGGEPLYKLARKGIVIEREPREVDVYSIEVLSMAECEAVFKVVCGKGTYVRSICHDVGLALGCGAHLSGLRRAQSGVFTEDEAVSAEAGREVLSDALIPLEAALARARTGAAG
jgi:tRNA pseudouridine55 synthase